jgi:hypothetical protein
MKKLLLVIIALLLSLAAREVRADSDQSIEDEHINMSYSDSPCALAGERALETEVDGEEFDFESTYEWAFDACERATSIECQ